MYTFREFFYNNKIVFFIETSGRAHQLESAQPEKIKLYFTLGHDNINFVYGHLAARYPETTVFFVRRRTTLENSHLGGIVITIEMHRFNIIRSDEKELEMDRLFEGKLASLLAGRMEPKFIEIYLSALRASLVLKNRVDNTATTLNYDICISTTDQVLHMVSSLTDEQIRTIEKIIIENELNFQICPNVFNLHQSNSRQQSALSIKKIQVPSDETNVDVKYILYNQMDPRAIYKFAAGKMYIPNNIEFRIVCVNLELSELRDIIIKKLVYAFKVISSSMSRRKVILFIHTDVFKEFSILKIKSRLLQYVEIFDDDLRMEPIYCLSVIPQHPHMLLQLGCPRLLRLATFSHETLNTNCKTFEVYGIFCPEYLQFVSRENYASIFIKRIVSEGPFIYYYAHIHFRVNHLLSFPESIVKYSTRQCRSHIDPTTIPQTITIFQWMLRPCATMIYHTYFKWAGPIIEKIAAMERDSPTLEIDAARDISAAYKKYPEFSVIAQNLINFKFITSTQSLNMYATTDDERLTLVQYIVETYRNMARDILIPLFSTRKIGDVKQIRYSHIDGIMDGALTAAVSVRSCEKLVDPKNNNVMRPCMVINASMLINNPDYKGNESSKNCIDI